MKFLNALLLLPVLAIAASAVTYHVRGSHHFPDGTHHYDRDAQVAVTTDVPCGFSISSGTKSQFVIERVEQ